MKTENISLSDFVAIFLVALHDSHARLPKPDRQSVWHRSFARIRAATPSWPGSMKDLRFDWDGVRGKSPNLQEALDTMRGRETIRLDMRDMSDCFNQRFIGYWRQHYSHAIAELKPDLELAVAIFREEYEHAHAAAQAA